MLSCATRMIVPLRRTCPGKCGKTVRFRYKLEAEFKLIFSLNSDVKIFPKGAATIDEWPLESTAAQMCKNVTSV